MTIHITRKTAISWRPAAVVLLAVTAFAPSRAAASCGDYVMIGGGHALHGNPAGHESRSSGDGKLQPDDSAPCRCQGAGCSDGSQLPIGPASEFKLTLERWATVDGGADRSSSSAHRLPAGPRIARASGHGLGILRPPR